MNAETLLHATRGVLQQRGRAFNDYADGDKVCLLGAMGVAAGRDPHYWSELVDAYPEDLEPVDYTLMEAGRLLAAVIDPHSRAADFDADQVIDVVSAWHDGPDASADAAVYDALAEAARLAELASA